MFLWCHHFIVFLEIIHLSSPTACSGIIGGSTGSSAGNPPNIISVIVSRRTRDAEHHPPGRVANSGPSIILPEAPIDSWRRVAGMDSPLEIFDSISQNFRQHRGLSDFRQRSILDHSSGRSVAFTQNAGSIFQRGRPSPNRQFSEMDQASRSGQGYSDDTKIVAAKCVGGLAVATALIHVLANS